MTRRLSGALVPFFVPMAFEVTKVVTTMMILNESPNDAFCVRGHLLPLTFKCSMSCFFFFRLSFIFWVPVLKNSY